MIFEKQKYGLGILVDRELDVSKLEESETMIIISKGGECSLDSESWTLNKINVVVKDNLKVKIKDDFSGVRGLLLNIEVGENSEVEFESFLGGENFVLREAFVKKNGFLNWNDKLSSGFGRIFTKTYLEESSVVGSKLVSNGVEDDLFDVNNEVIHLGDNSRSEIVNKAVLDGKSRQVYRGLIKINGENCKGNQKSNTLLLSSQARADNIPNLEIENNEVVCGHGVSISKIDENVLFYMMSRGLSLEEAKKEFVRGFLDGN
tara:strand:- start:4453 stop:5235 length:783 start_codon:yes stop_codon:yes gene_type:complete